MCWAGGCGGIPVNDEPDGVCGWPLNSRVNSPGPEDAGACMGGGVGSVETGGNGAGAEGLCDSGGPGGFAGGASQKILVNSPGSDFDDSAGPVPTVTVPCEMISVVRRLRLVSTGVGVASWPLTVGWF